MSELHQIFATHCTYATSALERRKGEAGERVLGYSARASSFDRPTDLRQYYRAVERLIYYYLPSDQSADKKAVLTPDTAPRRLVFHPSSSGLRIVAQICYRQTDCAGRLGSYFAHAIFEKSSDNPELTILDSLQLYGAPGWATKEDEHQDFKLPTLSSAADIQKGSQPFVNDRIVLEFLSSANGGITMKQLPARWRDMSPEIRRNMFLKAFAGYLAMAAKDSRDQMLLLVEPEMAVVFYYGILRLLPPVLRERLSFSTYETNPDRLYTTFSALHFADATSNDIKAERYKKGFVLNTFRTDGKICTPLPQRPPIYAKAALSKVLKSGWKAVDAMHADFARLGMTNVSDLDNLAKCDALAREIPDPKSTISDPNWRQDPKKLPYLRWKVSDQFRATLSRKTIDGLLKSPTHLWAVLELIATDTCLQQCERSAVQLVDGLQPEQYPHFLQLANVAPRLKDRVLRNYVVAHEALPLGCEFLWKELAPQKGRRTRSDSLMTALLGRPDAKNTRGLSNETLNAFWKNTPGRYRLSLYMHVLDKAEGNPDRLSWLRRWVGGLDEKQLSELVHNRSDDLIVDAEGHRGDVLGQRLLTILHELPKNPKRFGKHLAMLDKVGFLLPGGRGCVDAWLEIDGLFKQGREQGNLDSLNLCIPLADALRRAIPVEHHTNDEMALQVLDDEPPSYQEAKERAEKLSSLAHGLGLLIGPSPVGFENRIIKYMLDPAQGEIDSVIRLRQTQNVNKRFLTRDKIYAAAITTCLAALLVVAGLFLSSYPLSNADKRSNFTAEKTADEGASETHNQDVGSQPKTDHRTAAPPATVEGGNNVAEASHDNAGTKKAQADPPATDQNEDVTDRNNSVESLQEDVEAQGTRTDQPAAHQHDEEARGPNFGEGSSERITDNGASTDQTLADTSRTKQTVTDSAAAFGVFLASAPIYDFPLVPNGVGFDMLNIEGDEEYEILIHGLPKKESIEEKTKSVGEWKASPVVGIRPEPTTTGRPKTKLEAKTQDGKSIPLAEFFFKSPTTAKSPRVLRCNLKSVGLPQYAYWTYQLRFCVVELKPKKNNGKSLFVALQQPEHLEFTLLYHNDIGGMKSLRGQKPKSSKVPDAGAESKLYLGGGTLFQNQLENYEFGNDAMLQPPRTHWPFDEDDPNIGIGINSKREILFVPNVPFPYSPIETNFTDEQKGLRKDIDLADGKAKIEQKRDKNGKVTEREEDYQKRKTSLRRTALQKLARRCSVPSDNIPRLEDKDGIQKFLVQPYDLDAKLRRFLQKDSLSGANWICTTNVYRIVKTDSGKEIRVTVISAEP